MDDADQIRVFAKKVAIVLLLVFLWFIRDIAVLLIISGVLAAGIAPVVERTRALIRLWFRRRIARSSAVLLVYLHRSSEYRPTGRFLVSGIVRPGPPVCNRVMPECGGLPPLRLAAACCRVGEGRRGKAEK